MKIYSLLLVKDEADIIEDVLCDAVKWSDKIIVFDNGSSDDTWSIVNRLAKKYRQIVPFVSDATPFRIGLRAKLFDAFKSELSRDDWWCVRMDADEFYIDNPRSFLADVPRLFSQVSKASFDYQITYEDLDESNFIGEFKADCDKIRYYNPLTWSETRFVRHSPKLTWVVDERKPQPCGMTYYKPIRVRHYQFRSPQQMQRRNEVRKISLQNNCGSFRHEVGKEWCDYLKHRADLICDPQDGTFPTLGSKNRVWRWYKELYKLVLTLFRYY